MRAPYSSSSSSSAAAASITGNNKAVGTPCCSKDVDIKRGPWTPEEDEVLSNYVNKEGEGRWRTLPKRAGLQRCGKSCRLRWVNYLRPNVKRGPIDPDEEDLILRLHRLLGNRWSLIAGRIPGRTDNEIKNFWNTHLSKKLISQGIDPRNHKPLNPNPSPPNNYNNFVPPNNTYAPMPSSNPPAYQNPPVISHETTRGTQQFNHQQVHLDCLGNVMNGQNQLFTPCNDDLQNIDRLISTDLPNNNNHNVYPSYVTDSSGNYYQDSFALFLDALINEPYGGSQYHRPNVTWELAQVSTENAGNQQQLNDITHHQ